MRPTFLLPALALCLALGSRAGGSELRIRHSVIKKMVAERVFTDEGRKYIRGDRKTTCSYAWLEQPEIGGEGNQLTIRARFTGRSGGNFLGNCISIGDSFTALIRATPYYRDGYVRLKDVRVDSPAADGFYIRRVRANMARALSTDFAFKLDDEAKRILEEPTPGLAVQKSLVRFHVPEIQVTSEALILRIDYVLDVR